MKKRILAVALSLCLLAGCGAQPVELPEKEEPDNSPVIAYVPLDDRPDNVGRVRYLAESLGYTLNMPERDLYRTALDGQPRNTNGTPYGDRAKLYEWVLEQEAAGCDRYILFTDQLLSGGLVNSRHISHTGSQPSITLSDGTELTEQGLLENLLTALAADEHNQVWLLDSVMRLAPTCGYDGFGLDEYNALREYGMQPRPELPEGAADPAQVSALYRKTPTGADYEAADFGLSDETVADYLSARLRKLNLTDSLFQTLGSFTPESGLSGAEFHVLIGIDDSSSEDCIQKNEIACLRPLLREGDGILSGVDDLAFKAVTKLYLHETGWTGAKVNVQYFGGTEALPACDYDYQPLTEIVAEHLDYFGLTAEDSPALADLHVLVLTQPGDPGQMQTYIRDLIRVLKQRLEANLPVILIDAGNGRYGTAFHDTLTGEVPLGQLLSYAGFLDMAIVTGTALSHGLARYAHLMQGKTSQAEESAFCKTLADSILKDFCYKNAVRENILAYVRNELGGDPNNFWLPELDRTALAERLTADMEEAAAPVLKNLERSNLPICLNGDGSCALAGWGAVSLSGYCFPWDRAFEMDMEITVDPPSQPHKAVLGLYYR